MAERVNRGQLLGTREGSQARGLWLPAHLAAHSPSTSQQHGLFAAEQNCQVWLAQGPDSSSIGLARAQEAGGLLHQLHLAPGSNTKAALAHKYSHSGQQAWFCRPVIQPEGAHRGVGPQRCVVLGVQVLEHAQKGQGTQGALQALAVRVTCHAAAAHRCRAQSCVRKEVARLFAVGSRPPRCAGHSEAFKCKAACMLLLAMLRVRIAAGHSGSSWTHGAKPKAVRFYPPHCSLRQLQGTV